jgi:endoglucanase
MKPWSRGARSAGLLMAMLCAGTLAVCGALLLGGRNAATLEVRVSGNELANANGQQVVLHGVDRSGGEFACVRDLGIWTGPMNQASVTAMKKWKVNAVRVPLNEACWNGLSYVPAKYRGTRYRHAIKAYVQLLNRNGLVVILDLHWTQGVYTGPTSHCASAEAVCQKPMPDAAQAIPFWTSVARTFRGDDAVIFDLFNEPYPELAAGSSEDAGWRCWLRGGAACIGISYKVAGMQALVNAVRSVGASNVIMLGGLGYANDLSQWLKYEPTDPDHNLAASWHSYNWNGCSSRSCWDSQIAPVIAKVPVIAGEIGESGCTDTYIDRLMTWLDARSTGYLAWAWNTGFTCSGRGLIKSYDGEPTAYGGGFRSHLRSLNKGHARIPVNQVSGRGDSHPPALAESSRPSATCPARSIAKRLI